MRLVLTVLLLMMVTGPCYCEVALGGEFKTRPCGYHVPVMQLDPTGSIVFHYDGEVVGALEWTGGTVVFHGNVDDSAMLFFEYLFDHYMVVGCPKEPQTAPTWGVSDDSDPSY